MPSKYDAKSFTIWKYLQLNVESQTLIGKNKFLFDNYKAEEKKVYFGDCISSTLE